MTTSAVKNDRWPTRVAVVLCAAMLCACGTIGTVDKRKIKPATPTLPSLTVAPDGGIALDRQDTERLMKYIIDLEKGYE